MTTRRALIDDLLQKTSRTFALSIPLLPEPLRSEVGVGYLLFRIADTLEDAERLGRDERIEQLTRCGELFAAPTLDASSTLAEHWQAQPVSTNDEYNRLLAEAPEVIAELLTLEPASVAALTRHVRRSCEGMAETLRSADEAGSFQLETVEDLRQYCYFVAGIVGEMLTELFQARLEPSAARDALDEDARAFGEGLQLVNILKDAPDDASWGRTYLPTSVPRDEVFALARQDLAQASRYSQNLLATGAPAGVVAFAELPRQLAEKTLDVLQEGAARKVTREEVARTLADVERLVASGEAQL